MKNVSITFSAPSLTIPLNYHHEVQSLLYRLLRDNSGANNWHDSGAAYGLRQYKLFTFSSLRGKRSILNDRICFENLVYLDVRSVRDDFCGALLSALKTDDAISLFSQPLTVQKVKSSSEHITADRINIKMLSPLTVHKTDEAGITYYYTPLDNCFSEQINNNFLRKYSAYIGHTPISSVSIVPVRIGARDKYVTKYKGIHIAGWRGEYQLSGYPEYLNFLYYCGLGARNSDGFGMFELV